jgi:hypothetical protein
MTISIIAYNNISQRAVEISVKIDLINAYKQLKIYQAEKNGYPNDISDCSSVPASGNICINKNMNNTLVSYVVDNTINPQGFCINIKDGENNNYKITSNKYEIPVKTEIYGDCFTKATFTQDFIIPGIYTWVVPDDTISVKVEVWGAVGGQGFGACFEFDPCAQGGDGGNGGYAVGNLAVLPDNNLSVSVGAVGMSGLSGGRSLVTLFDINYVIGNGGGAGQNGSVEGHIRTDGSPGVPGVGDVYTSDGKLTSTATAEGVIIENNGNGKAILTWETTVYDF